MKKFKISILIGLFFLVFPMPTLAYKLKSSNIYQKYEEHSNISECDALRNKWQAVSYKCGDTGLCYKTDDPGISNITHESNLCYAQIAAEQKDSSICFQKDNFSFPMYQSLCLTELAILNNDSSYCDKINEIFFPIDSLSNIPASQQKNANNDQCFSELALNSGDFFACDKIVEQGVGFENDYFGFKQSCYTRSIAKNPNPIVRDPDLCKSFSQFKKGGENNTIVQDDKSGMCYHSALEGMASYPNLLLEVAKNPSICSKYPEKYNYFQEYEGRNKCYFVAYSRLMREDLDDFLGKNPDICKDFNADIKIVCYENSLDRLKKIEQSKFIAQNPDICSKYPDSIADKCYVDAEAGIAKFGIGNYICNKFPPSELASNNFFKNFLGALQFKKIISDKPGREKCFLTAGLMYSDWSQNNPSFVEKNIASIVLLIIFVLANLAALNFAYRKRIWFSVFLMIFFPILCIIFFWLSFLGRLFLEIKFFYPILAYLAFIFLVNPVLLIYLKGRLEKNIINKTE